MARATKAYFFMVLSVGFRSSRIWLSIFQPLPWVCIGLADGQRVAVRQHARSEVFHTASMTPPTPLPPSMWLRIAGHVDTDPS
jgi:hypothetical protein